MGEEPAFGSRWWIVFGATLSMMVAQGPVILYTLGLFIKPLNQDFGWDRASISAAGGLAAISSAIAVPFVGWLIDRWGIRTILLPIVVLSAFSIALIALTPNSIVVFMLFFAITGFLGSGLGRNDERDRPWCRVGPAICPVAYRQLWLAHGLCRTWPAYLDDRVSGHVSVHQRADERQGHRSRTRRIICSFPGSAARSRGTGGTGRAPVLAYRNRSDARLDRDSRHGRAHCTSVDGQRLLTRDRCGSHGRRWSLYHGWPVVIGIPCRPDFRAVRRDILFPAAVHRNLPARYRPLSRRRHHQPRPGIRYRN